MFIPQDPEGSKRLLADEFSPIKYDAEKPQDMLDEDKLIGARKPNVATAGVRITPVDQVWARLRESVPERKTRPRAGLPRIQGGAA